MATFLAKILSPVNIGTGDTMDLLDYKLQDNILYCLDFSRFLIELSEEKMRRFNELTDENDIKGLRLFITDNCDEKKYATRSMIVGQDFIKKYQSKFNDLRNQMEVHSFTYSAHNSKAYIPGSSIKGAIRTALVSRFAPEGVTKYEANLKKLEHDIEMETDHRWKEKKKRALQKEKERYRKDFAGVALQCNIGSDPLRVVKVSDTELPDRSTKIERIENMVVDHDGNLKKNLESMWYEVTGSLLTDNTIECEVDIKIDTKAQKVGRFHLSKQVTERDIISACNSFYQNRLKWEYEKFYKRDSKATLLTEKLQQETFGDDSFLLRIGRFSHFESLSADGYREGFNRQKKMTITEGSTRNLCRGYIPLGWVKFEKLRLNE